MQFDFLMCSERSGSNLITKILNAHPEVCGPFPSHLFRTFTDNYLRYGDLSREENWEILTEDVVFYMERIFAQWKTLVDIHELRRLPEHSLAAAGRAIYEKEAAAHDKVRLFVKENHTWSFVEYLLSHFPDSRFVWLVRDPRDMALTWRTMTRGGAIRATDTWLADQRGSLRAHSFLRDIGRIELVRFEDLVAEPEAQARGVCEFLGLDYDPVMLEFHTVDLVAENAARIVSWEKLRGPIDPGNVGIYREGLSEPEIRYIESRCAAEMDLFGYSREFADPGDTEQLALGLPPEDAHDREQTEAEREAYRRFGEAGERVRSRDITTDGTALRS